jgi:hypothetical protein
MTRRAANLLTAAGAAIALAGAIAATWQWWATQPLRHELTRLRGGAAELATLRAENERLRRERIAPAELERLRADHTALLRLHAEIEEIRLRSARRSSQP